MSIQAYWYRSSLHPLMVPLLPFSLAFGLVTRLRRLSYQLGLKKTEASSVPVIIIGNITVGGTGKTPLVLELANYLKSQGKNPGIALRGVGGRKKQRPTLVSADSDPFEVGDEAVLLAKNTNCPVVTCIDRPAAVKALAEAACDLVLCDDGLQHYRLGRKLEIAVIDGSRYFGNGLLLPAGPLREPLARLKEVDFIVVNEHENSFTANTHLKKPHFHMQLKTEAFISAHDPKQTLTLSSFSGQKVHAIAGIGNPQRFFDLLSHLKIEVIPHAFPDHHRYKTSDLDFSDQLPILMTEKDAIKCKTLAFENSLKAKHWFLQVTTEVSPELKQALLEKIQEKRNEKFT